MHSFMPTIHPIEKEKTNERPVGTDSGKRMFVVNIKKEIDPINPVKKTNYF